MSAKLYIVSTPIGNLEDISPRALRVLGEVDIIACEDTRTTGKLLSRFNIKKPLESYHEHNEAEKAKVLVNMLQDGNSVALVTDAGTPGVSDPGYRLVNLASKQGIEVVSVPGPSAAIAALSVSGLPTDRFAFIGFLPRTKKKLIEAIESLKRYPETLIFFESPKRVVKTLGILKDQLGERRVSVSREITKMYEETIRGSITEVLEQLSSRETLKGEFTIVVSGCGEAESQASDKELERLLKIFYARGSSLKDTVKEVSDSYGVSKSMVYKMALKIWD